KVQLVLDGSKQVRGVSYIDSWAPSLPHAGWHLFLHICAVEDLELLSLDVNNVFVQGSRQAGNLWFKYLRAFLRKWGFVPLDTAETIYLRGSLSAGDFQMLAIQVDDIQVASQSVALQKKFVVNQLGSVFKHMFSPASRFVGYDLERDRAAKTIKVTAASKVAHVLEAHGLGEVHPKYTPCAPGVHLSSDSSGQRVDVNTYQSLVGAFQFIREFRPDISFAVGKLSKFLVSPNLDHMDAALYLAGYLRRTAS
ncbi:unnamed protein product, partial [Heterosigma akashiwo]